MKIIHTTTFALALLACTVSLPVSEASACSCAYPETVEWLVGEEHPLQARGFFALDYGGFWVLQDDDGWQEDVTLERSVDGAPFESIEFTTESVDGGWLFVPSEPLAADHRYIVSAPSQSDHGGAYETISVETRIVDLDEVVVSLSVGDVEEGTLNVEDAGCSYEPEARYRSATVGVPAALEASSKIRFHVGGDSYYLSRDACEPPSRSWGLGDERTSGYLAHLVDFPDSHYSLASGEQDVAVHVTLPGTDYEWTSNAVTFSLAQEGSMEESPSGCSSAPTRAPSSPWLLIVGLGLVFVRSRRRA